MGPGTETSTVCGTVRIEEIVSVRVRVWTTSDVTVLVEVDILPGTISGQSDSLTAMYQG